MQKRNSYNYAITTKSNKLSKTEQLLFVFIKIKNYKL